MKSTTPLFSCQPVPYLVRASSILWDLSLWCFSYSASLIPPEFHTKITKVVYPPTFLKVWKLHHQGRSFTATCVCLTCLKPKLHTFLKAHCFVEGKENFFHLFMVFIFSSVSLRVFGFQPVYHFWFPSLTVKFSEYITSCHADNRLPPHLQAHIHPSFQGTFLHYCCVVTSFQKKETICHRPHRPLPQSIFRKLHMPQRSLETKA